MKKALIYSRVSTRDQNPEMQIEDLRYYAKARKFKIVKEYVDYGSGSKSDQENYLKMFDDVRKRKCDVV
ncbi:MAG: recombinase family protein [Ignavibacteriae bacterium]|nr:recombinase family protein [Ignavibacteriota bacterium]